MHENFIMKSKFIYLIPLFTVLLMSFSCSKSDDPETIAVRDYAEQYAKDKESIETFLKTHSMTVNTDYDVTFATVASLASNCIFLQSNLQSRDVEEDGITYKLYYIKLNEGTQNRPSAVDSIFVSYRGVKLDNVQFDKSQSPVWFKVQDLITGWAHVIPDFKTGTYSTTGGVTTFSNFGAGVMFLPSGLAYFNQSIGTIDQYEPIVFNFKLYELDYRDHDLDGIFSKDEVPDGSTIFYNPINNDTDADGVPNMYDIDDDGDHYMTKVEIKNPLTGLPYAFADIPTCADGKKKHISTACH